MLSRRRRNEVFGNPAREQDGGLLTADPFWEANNLTVVRLLGLDYRIHKKAKEPFLALIDAWMRAGVFKWVRTLDRIYAFQTTPDGRELGRHCHGHAFDVNSAWNPIGRPAHMRAGGTLPLLEVARAQGWTCLADRGPVAKHFELARIQNG